MQQIKYFYVILLFLFSCSVTKEVSKVSKEAEKEGQSRSVASQSEDRKVTRVILWETHESLSEENSEISSYLKEKYNLDQENSLIEKISTNKFDKDNYGKMTTMVKDAITKQLKALKKDYLINNEKGVASSPRIVLYINGHGQKRKKLASEMFDLESEARFDLQKCIANFIQYLLINSKSEFEENKILPIIDIHSDYYFASSIKKYVLEKIVAKDGVYNGHTYPVNLFMDWRQVQKIKAKKKSKSTHAKQNLAVKNRLIDLFISLFFEISTHTVFPGETKHSPKFIEFFNGFEGNAQLFFTSKYEDDDIDKDIIKMAKKTNKEGVKAYQALRWRSLDQLNQDELMENTNMYSNQMVRGLSIKRYTERRPLKWEVVKQLLSIIDEDKNITDISVQLIAVAALKKEKDNSYDIPFRLTSFLNTSSYPVQLRAAIVSALAESIRNNKDTGAHFDLLEYYLSKSEPMIRATTAKTLAELDLRRAAEKLRAMETDTSKNVRLQVSQILQMFQISQVLEKKQKLETFKTTEGAIIFNSEYYTELSSDIEYYIEHLADDDDFKKIMNFILNEMGYSNDDPADYASAFSLAVKAKRQGISFQKLSTTFNQIRKDPSITKVMAICLLKQKLKIKKHKDFYNKERQRKKNDFLIKSLEGYKSVRVGLENKLMQDYPKLMRAHLKDVKLAVSMGADLNSNNNKDKIYPVEKALPYTTYSFEVYDPHKRMDALYHLLDNGADINQKYDKTIKVDKKSKEYLLIHFEHDLKVTRELLSRYKKKISKTHREAAVQLFKAQLAESIPKIKGVKPQIQWEESKLEEYKEARKKIRHILAMYTLYQMPLKDRQEIETALVIFTWKDLLKGQCGKQIKKDIEYYKANLLDDGDFIQIMQVAFGIYQFPPGMRGLRFVNMGYFEYDIADYASAFSLAVKVRKKKISSMDFMRAYNKLREEGNEKIEANQLVKERLKIKGHKDCFNKERQRKKNDYLIESLSYYKAVFTAPFSGVLMQSGHGLTQMKFHLEDVKLAIRMGADVDSNDNKAKIYPVEGAFPYITYSFEIYDPHLRMDALYYLLDTGADVNRKYDKTIKVGERSKEYLLVHFVNDLEVTKKLLSQYGKKISKAHKEAALQLFRNQLAANLPKVKGIKPKVQWEESKLDEYKKARKKIKHILGMYALYQMPVNDRQKIEKALNIFTWQDLLKGQIDKRIKKDIEYYKANLLNDGDFIQIMQVAFGIYQFPRGMRGLRFINMGYFEYDIADYASAFSLAVKVRKKKISSMDFMRAYNKLREEGNEKIEANQLVKERLKITGHKDFFNEERQRKKNDYLIESLSHYRAVYTSPRSGKLMQNSCTMRLHFEDVKLAVRMGADISSNDNKAKVYPVEGALPYTTYSFKIYDPNVRMDALYHLLDNGADINKKYDKTIKIGEKSKEFLLVHFVNNLEVTKKLLSRYGKKISKAHKEAAIRLLKTQLSENLPKIKGVKPQEMLEEGKFDEYKKARRIATHISEMYIVYKMPEKEQEELEKALTLFTWDSFKELKCGKHIEEDIEYYLKHLPYDWDFKTTIKFIWDKMGYFEYDTADYASAFSLAVRIRKKKISIFKVRSVYTKLKNEFHENVAAIQKFKEQLGIKGHKDCFNQERQRKKNDYLIEFINRYNKYTDKYELDRIKLAVRMGADIYSNNNKEKAYPFVLARSWAWVFLVDTGVKRRDLAKVNLSQKQKNYIIKQLKINISKYQKKIKGLGKTPKSNCSSKKCKKYKRLKETISYCEEMIKFLKG